MATVFVVVVHLSVHHHRLVYLFKPFDLFKRFRQFHLQIISLKHHRLQLELPIMRMLSSLLRHHNRGGLLLNHIHHLVRYALLLFELGEQADTLFEVLVADIGHKRSGLKLLS